MDRQFSNLLRKLHDFNRNVQCAALKEIAVVIQKANKRDLQDLLEFLNTTNDTELQVKLFSILAVYLLSKNDNCEIIISCKPLYDKIQDVLNRGLPQRTSTTLNFIQALLSFETDDNQRSINLAMFARNTMRVTGCLSNMSSLLTSGMMYQDTWIALCHSIAEVCRGSEVNQSYCSHLVPFCVQSCLQGNIEIFSVLQSLLHNHERNIQLFLETNGISIFTRESLQHNTCMQLLNTIVQKSALAISLLRKTNVIHDVGDFLRLSGPFSQIGQWSRIILYHLDSGTKKETAVEDTITDNVSKKNSTIHIKNKTINICTNVSITPELDETKNLFQNVINEVLQWKSQNNNNFKIPLAPKYIFKKHAMKRNHTTQHNSMASFVNNHHKTKWVEVEKSIPNIVEPHMHEHNTLASKDLSFSMLFKDNFRKMNLNSNYDTEDTRCGSENCSEVTNTPQTLIINTDKNPRMDTSDFHQTAELRDDDKKSEIDLIHFKPTFMSTPKRQVVERQNRVSRSYFRNNTQVDKINKQRRNSKKQPLVEKMKQRSMSARLFSAINDSCTTFVKSVKSIFKSKENTNTLQDEITNMHTVTAHEQLENASCSYSFTDYMSKRDAILASNCTKTDIDYDDFSIEMRKSSCKTCSDTLILRSKLNHNEHLKKTLKKLKMGINLFGCDFKKISKVMWPRERYMTPKVLNNLYRKLILKQ